MRPAVSRSAGGMACAALVLMAGCSTPIDDRIVLLPGTGDRPTGAVTVKAAKGDLLLSQPYQQANVSASGVTAEQSSAEKVQATYGAMLAMQPERPRNWVVYFVVGADQLTAESKPVLDELRAALSGYEAGEVVVTGHTDRVGSVTDNDRLSLVRANAVRDLLIAAGVPATRITASGRGERSPVVPTADEVAEARNRRVEIKLR